MRNADSVSCNCPPVPVKNRKRKLGHDARHGSNTRYRSLQPDASRQRRRKRRRTGRPWVCSPCDLSSFKDRFVIVSYNILGVENASRHQDLYKDVDSEHLSWGHRKIRIYNELKVYNPDVICFQEVDRYDDLVNLLGGDGYVGVYKGRTGDSKDGCAIFWKEQQFTLLHQESIEFGKLQLRENVAQICLLKVTSKDKEHSGVTESLCHRTLLVGNIHVLFNPNRGDIKLGQVRVLLERVHALSKEWSNCPIVISGDLNSTPQSAIYRYLSTSELEITRYERRKISGQIELSLTKVPYSVSMNSMRSSSSEHKYFSYRWSEEEIRLASGHKGCTCLLNPMKLSSAYGGVPGSRDTRDANGEPLVTSFHSKFMGTVDYIWHCSALTPVRVVETLPINELKKLGGLPSKEWGSDHLALVCEFAFVTDDKQMQC